MDLRNIKTFIRVTELGSFTKVANEMNYVQSAITMQIKQLEKELGFPLFDRIGKSVSLTAMGTEFLNYAYDIIHIMQKASNIEKNITDIHGTLRLGVLESLLYSKMLCLLPKFKNTYKNMNFQIKMGQTTELLNQLKQNQLDMVYLSAGLNSDPDLTCHYKRQENLIFVCNPNHNVSQKKKLSISELFKHDFIVTEHTGICYGRLQELAQRNNSVLHTSIEVDSTVAISTLLQSNTAIAFLPEYSVEKQLNEGLLSRVDVDLEPQVYYSQILVHKNRWLSPFIEKIIEEIKLAYPEK